MVTVTCVVAEQPKEFVAVTVYVVFIVGETVTVCPLRFPGVQLNVVSIPVTIVADNCVGVPGQMEAGFALAVTDALLFNVTVTCCMVTHPFASVMVQVYVPGDKPVAVGVV